MHTPWRSRCAAAVSRSRVGEPPTVRVPNGHLDDVDDPVENQAAPPLKRPAATEGGDLRWPPTLLSVDASGSPEWLRVGVVVDYALANVGGAFRPRRSRETMRYGLAAGGRPNDSAGR